MDTFYSIGPKIKALRKAQGLTQEELARKGSIPYTTLTKIESGVIKNPSIETAQKVAEALGVSLEHLLLIHTYEGKDATSFILDDVYDTLKDSGGEVFISGIDERKFLEADREAILQHITRLTKQGITERLLAREGDSFFFPGSQSVYRWVPENLFNPTPIYVYGDKVAMLVWGPPQQVVIIKNAALTDAYRKQFIFIWERAQVPPTKNVTHDDRTRAEKMIVKRFGGRVSSLSRNDERTLRGLFAQQTTESYGNSFYYLAQATHGIGKEKLGLKFFDGEMCATLGLFNRASLGGGWHFHIVHPVGKFDARKILSLSKAMLEVTGNPVFVKKLDRTQQEELLALGFSTIEEYPWHADALEEDDTFPEQIIRVNDTLHRALGSHKNDLKDKHQRFLTKFAIHLDLRELTPLRGHDAQHITKRFFDYLEMKNLHISEPSDYDNIIFNPPLGKNGEAYFSSILYIKNTPAAFFAMEPISPRMLGLYANVALYKEFPYISEYLITLCTEIASKAGYEFLNLGGSETSGLFQFKEKFGPVSYNKMHWVVYKLG